MGENPIESARIEMTYPQPTSAGRYHHCLYIVKDAAAPKPIHAASSREGLQPEIDMSIRVTAAHVRVQPAWERSFLES
jgi:hypothetical protein